MHFDHLELSPTADFHVHLRDGSMTETVTPLIKQGGVNLVYVMVFSSSIQNSAIS